MVRIYLNTNDRIRLRTEVAALKPFFKLSRIKGQLRQLISMKNGSIKKAFINRIEDISAHMDEILTEMKSSKGEM